MKPPELIRCPDGQGGYKGVPFWDAVDQGMADPADPATWIAYEPEADVIEVDFERRTFRYIDYDEVDYSDVGKPRYIP